MKILKGKAKPFVKWVGGKTQLIENIQGVLPKNFINGNNYLGVPLSGRVFRSNLFARSSQKGFPLQSLTQKQCK